MTDPLGREQSASSITVPARRSLHHLMMSAACVWLPRSWAAEWLVLLGMILADSLSRMLPMVAAVVRHG